MFISFQVQPKVKTVRGEKCLSFCFLSAERKEGRKRKLLESFEFQEEF